MPSLYKMTCEWSFDDKFAQGFLTKCSTNYLLISHQMRQIERWRHNKNYILILLDRVIITDDACFIWHCSCTRRGVKRFCSVCSLKIATQFVTCKFSIQKSFLTEVYIALHMRWSTYEPTGWLAVGGCVFLEKWYLERVSVVWSSPAAVWWVYYVEYKLFKLLANIAYTICFLWLAVDTDAVSVCAEASSFSDQFLGVQRLHPRFASVKLKFNYVF